jgi:Pyruvate/2-oxoacid:ferredoxin oxidoreductase delta subunit
MSPLFAAAWLVLLVGSLVAALFLITCLQEQRWRGAVVVAVLSLPLLAICCGLLLVDTSARPWIAAVLPAVALICVLIVALPFGSRKALRLVGEQIQVDERDAVFHRFYRIQPGSAEFELYYRDHPEKADRDQQLRELPDLARPGARSYAPLTAPMLHAVMDTTSHSFGDSADVDFSPRPMNGQPTRAPAKQLSSRIKGFARYLGADLVGCTLLNQAYVYSHIARGPGRWGAPITLEHSHAVAIAVQMEHDMVHHAPRLPLTLEASFRYQQSARIAVILARYISLLGYQARAHVDGNYRVMCVPVAVDAGLGELGRIGLLVTRPFGPRVRLAVVTTDLPLVQDPPIAFGVQHFCSICKKCAHCCPSDSIDAKEKSVHRGVEKWISKQDSCYHYWRRCGTDCGICLKVCPYAHPSSLAHEMVRWAIQRNPLVRRLALWCDDLIYGRRPKGRFGMERWLEQSNP